MYVSEVVSGALRGESPALLPFMGDAPTHCFQENTPVQYIKESDRKGGQLNTPHLFPSFPSSFYARRHKNTPLLHRKIDEFCFNKGSMVIKCKIRLFRMPKTVPSKYPDQLKINQVGQNNKNPNWLV